MPNWWSRAFEFLQNSTLGLQHWANLIHHQTKGNFKICSEYLVCLPSQVTVCAVCRHTHTRSRGTQAGWADCAVLLLCVFLWEKVLKKDGDDINIKDSDGDKDNTWQEGFNFWWFHLDTSRRDWIIHLAESWQMFDPFEYLSSAIVSKSSGLVSTRWTRRTRTQDTSRTLVSAWPRRTL